MAVSLVLSVTMSPVFESSNKFIRTLFSGREMNSFPSLL